MSKTTNTLWVPGDAAPTNYTNAWVLGCGIIRLYMAVRTLLHMVQGGRS